jgi:hypothetical protein
MLPLPRKQFSPNQCLDQSICRLLLLPLLDEKRQEIDKDKKSDLCCSAAGADAEGAPPDFTGFDRAERLWMTMRPTYKPPSQCLVSLAELLGLRRYRDLHSPATYMIPRTYVSCDRRGFPYNMLLNSPKLVTR